MIASMETERLFDNTERSRLSHEQDSEKAPPIFVGIVVHGSESLESFYMIFLKGERPIIFFDATNFLRSRFDPLNLLNPSLHPPNNTSISFPAPLTDRQRPSAHAKSDETRC
jgi:hypothetical protein